MAQTLDKGLVVKSYKTKTVTHTEVCSDLCMISRVGGYIEKYDPSKSTLLLNQFVILKETFREETIPVILESKMLESGKLDRLYSVLHVLGFETFNCELDDEVLTSFNASLEENPHYEEIFRSGSRQTR